MLVCRARWRRVCTALWAATALLAAAAPAAAREKAVDLVDPFVGTLGDFGQLTPAAVAPYGMVQLGPDTHPKNHAGYDFAARQLRGFSHTRAVGVGCGGGGGDLLVSLLPEGAPPLAAFDKASERASAGRYRVTYANGITAEMTATRGAGLLRFTVAKPGRYVLRFDAANAYTRRHAATITADLRASMTAGTVCDEGAYTIHSASRVTIDGRPAPLATVTGAAATLPLTLRRGAVVEVRTGLSTVDPAAAAMVRDTELGARPFATVLAATRARWQHELSRLDVSAPRERRALFYTSLYRVMQTPVAIQDPDGRHRGSDGRIHRSAPGETRYASWALWDNYRTQLPLIALIDPARAADIARSLVALYGEGKQRWATKTEPFLTVRTEHAGVALLDFRRRGITGFDARAALTGMVRESDTLQRDTPDQQIEAAYDDWAIAELAADLGDAATAARFRAKALAYRPMWRATFETLGADADVVKARGLYQGTLWQYRWAPVFDLDWMVETLGRDRFLSELDTFFARGLYNMTNQPDIHVPWLYAALGRPAATSAIVHRYLTQPVDHPYANEGKRPQPWHGRSFALAPQGFADGMDDDAGAMTAWYVWGSLGLYPLVPGKPEWAVAAPLVNRATLRLANGRVLEIRKNGTDAPTITLDGVPQAGGALALR
ncbi:glycoside hydrolase domain-containing protein [Sphingomonas sp. IC4-52]|uniref:glycoside hydrolase domain-containing protein n=1 Tax=Sphingomonas sp. IC4-52 TaxID=2887202 RepID=UPI001D10408E|nr:glycoside hydrolase domain-containing protein [Sphingomonas sp. IC4-52]MCC2981502.1 glycoside hydrolase family 92 protein [Sphingomonas sp. IC4-52]